MSRPHNIDNLDFMFASARSCSTFNQKFPAAIGGTHTWVREIPVPQHLVNLIPLFIEYERRKFLLNFERIIGFNRAMLVNQQSNKCPQPDNSVKHVFLYKPVDRKVRPISGITPEQAKVSRHFPSDPLEHLPSLPSHPPDFSPTTRFTPERMEGLAIEKNQDLTSEEQKLLKFVLVTNEQSIAFDEDERGTFRQDYFSDYIIPCMDHEPWEEKNIPIPPGFRKEILKLLQEKLENGVYVLNVSVSASHVIRSSDCGKISVVYSSSDPINQSLPFSPIMYLNSTKPPSPPIDQSGFVSRRRTENFGLSTTSRSLMG